MYVLSLFVNLLFKLQIVQLAKQEKKVAAKVTNHTDCCANTSAQTAAGETG